MTSPIWLPVRDSLVRDRSSEATAIRGTPAIPTPALLSARLLWHDRRRADPHHGPDYSSTTKSVRNSLHRAFSVVPQAANDTVVIEGDSWALSTVSVYLLVSVHGRRQFPARRDRHRWIRPELYGSAHDVAPGAIRATWLGWLRLDRPVRRGAIQFLQSSPFSSRPISSTAKRNICVAYSVGVGIVDTDLNTASVTYNHMVTSLNALRAGGQNWTVILGLVPFATPEGQSKHSTTW